MFRNRASGALNREPSTPFDQFATSSEHASVEIAP
jgi:hypothetical protein